MERHLGSRRGAVLFAALIAAACLLAGAPTSSGDLSSRERSLKQGIGADTSRVEAYRGRIRDLEARLAEIQSSLRIQRSLLVRIDRELGVARDRLKVLRGKLAEERRRLAGQLVAQYESPTPDLVSVVLEAHGFRDLLERVDQIKAIARQNAEVVAAVARAKSQVYAQTVRLADDQAHQRRVIAAVAVERDQVENLRLGVLEHERVAARDRARKQAELRQVQHQLAILQARAAAAQRASFAAPDVPTGGAGSDGGLYGFFPAPGSNYSVG
ncbi:MAG TPA: hypothetical protein VFH80_13745, partial [Solirubrobacteraceae bacterium]|nr:hypothetical protein [Solirubrobacteraceae bacterium]